MKTTRNLVKKLRTTKDKTEAQKLFRDVSSMVDKLAKTGVIHKNNASNKKSKLAKFVNHLS
jgi:small subunit ribosomal protein S20